MPSLNQTITDSPPARALGIIGICGKLGTYAWLVVASWRRQRIFYCVTCLWAAILLALESISVVFACIGGESAGLAGLVFIGVTAVCTLPPRWRIPIPVALCIIAIVLPRMIPTWRPDDWMAVSVLLASAGVNWFGQVLDSSRQLALAQEQLAALAVGQERMRIARELHDVLGQSLSAISIRSELANRLVQANPSRASRELTEVQHLAGAALLDLRSTVAAMRMEILSDELLGARQMLTVAGIDARLPCRVDNVPARYRELFAWTLREGVTNIVRHSAATRVEISLSADRITIDDDGRGPGRADTFASGLAGLRGRAAAQGAQMCCTRSPLGGFRLEVSALDAPRDGCQHAPCDECQHIEMTPKTTH